MLKTKPLRNGMKWVRLVYRHQSTGKHSAEGSASLLCSFLTSRVPSNSHGACHGIHSMDFSVDIYKLGLKHKACPSTCLGSNQHLESPCMLLLLPLLRGRVFHSNQYRNNIPHPRLGAPNNLTTGEVPFESIVQIGRSPGEAAE